MKTKFIITVICFITMTFAINSCKNPFNNLIGNKINDPKILVEKYLACKTWQERLLYVLDSTNVKALMEKHYSKADLTKPPKIKDKSHCYINTRAMSNICNI